MLINQDPHIIAPRKKIDSYSTELLATFFLELKHIVEVRSKPFNFHEQVRKGPSLFVGEGNMSFSRSFTNDRNIHPRFLTATTFENAEALTEETRKNASLLRAHGAFVRHNIDATTLERHFSYAKFSTIIFNFPNVASRDPKFGRNPNHTLVRRFLSSAKDILDQDGLVLISTVDSPHWRGAFQFPLAAKKSRFEISNVYRFYPSRFCGYTHTNTHDNDSALSSDDKFCTWVFRPV